MKFNEKLRTLRKEKGLSQEGLAELLDVSRQAISKWESGQSYPETEKLIALSDLFNVSLDSLVKDGNPLKEDENKMVTQFWLQRGLYYEYKSKRTIFGLPLVHIHIGHGVKRAKGIIAIGNIATGVIALGLLSKGILALGLLSLGLIGMGVLGIGLLCGIGAIGIGSFGFGAIAIGLISFGALSIGMFSVGAASFASHIAIGDYASGHIAIGRIAHGVRTIVDTSFSRNLSSITAEEVRTAITEEFPYLWNWIVNLMIFSVSNVKL